MLKHALVNPLTPIEWVEPPEVDHPVKDGEDEVGGIVTH